MHVNNMYVDEAFEKCHMQNWLFHVEVISISILLLLEYFEYICKGVMVSVFNISLNFKKNICHTNFSIYPHS